MPVWRNKSFIILFSGQLVSTLGDNLFSIALLWYVLDLTHSKTALTITGLATSLPPIFGSAVGIWVDRWNKKYTMLGSDFLRASILFTLFLITGMYTKPSFVVIVSLVVLVQLVGTFFAPAMSSLIPLIVDRERIAAATGLNMSGSALASLIGMLAGGGLLIVVGAPIMFLADSISFAVSLISMLFVHNPERKRHRNTKTSAYSEWKVGMRAILKSPFLLQEGLTSSINNFSLAAVGVVITPWVKDVLHASAFWLGGIYSSLLVGVIVGSLSAASISKRFSYRIISCITLVVLGIAVALTGIWPNIYWDIGLTLFAGVMLGIADGAGEVAYVLMTPEDVRGRVFSTLGTLRTMAAPIGIAILGTLMIHVRLPIVLALTGVGPIIGGLSYMLPFSKKAFAVLDEKTAAVAG